MPRQRDEELVRRIGRRVAQARKDRGWTQEQLSEAVGLEPVSLSRLETGDRAMLLSTLASIARVLNVSLGDLVDVAKEPAPLVHSRVELELLRLFAALSDSQKEAMLRFVKEFSATR